MRELLLHKERLLQVAPPFFEDVCSILSCMAFAVASSSDNSRLKSISRSWYLRRVRVSRSFDKGWRNKNTTLTIMAGHAREWISDAIKSRLLTYGPFTFSLNCLYKHLFPVYLLTKHYVKTMFLACQYFYWMLSICFCFARWHCMLKPDKSGSYAKHPWSRMVFRWRGPGRRRRWCAPGWGPWRWGSRR